MISCGETHNDRRSTSSSHRCGLPSTPFGFFGTRQEVTEVDKMVPTDAPTPSVVWDQVMSIPSSSGGSNTVELLDLLFKELQLCKVNVIAAKELNDGTVKDVAGEPCVSASLCSTTSSTLRGNEPDLFEGEAEEVSISKQQSAEVECRKSSGAGDTLGSVQPLAGDTTTTSATSSSATVASPTAGATPMENVVGGDETEGLTPTADLLSSLAGVATGIDASLVEAVASLSSGAFPFRSDYLGMDDFDVNSFIPTNLLTGDVSNGKTNAFELLGASSFFDASSPMVDDVLAVGSKGNEAAAMASEKVNNADFWFAQTQEYKKQLALANSENEKLKAQLAQSQRVISMWQSGCMRPPCGYMGGNECDRNREEERRKKQQLRQTCLQQMSMLAQKNLQELEQQTSPSRQQAKMKEQRQKSVEAIPPPPNAASWCNPWCMRPQDEMDPVAMDGRKMMIPCMGLPDEMVPNMYDGGMTDPHDKYKRRMSNRSNGVPPGGFGGGFGNRHPISAFHSFGDSMGGMSRLGRGGSEWSHYEKFFMDGMLN